MSDLFGGLGKAPPWASWLRIVIGAALIVFGVYRWLTRNRSEHMPGLMQALTTVTPARAVVTAAALTVLNPKVLFMCAAAGLAIGTAGLGASRSVGAVVWYRRGRRRRRSRFRYWPTRYRVTASTGRWTRLKEWMERQHAALVAAILIVIGLLVLYKGIHGL